MGLDFGVEVRVRVKIMGHGFLRFEWTLQDTTYKNAIRSKAQRITNVTKNERYEYIQINYRIRNQK